MLQGTFIAISAYIKKNRDLSNSVMMNLKLLEKQEQTKSKTSRQREMMKIRAEINETETKQTIQRINETKNWFFERINKINKPLATMTKWKREKTQINKFRDEKVHNNKH
jgi:hypothetical protein